MKALDLDTINDLLAPQPKTPKHVNTQKGPLRFYDKEMRCASRNCTSPTWVKIDGVPKCGMHALHDLNDIVLRLEDKLREQHIGGY